MVPLFSPRQQHRRFLKYPCPPPTAQFAHLLRLISFGWLPTSVLASLRNRRVLNSSRRVPIRNVVNFSKNGNTVRDRCQRESLSLRCANAQRARTLKEARNY